MLHQIQVEIHGAPANKEDGAGAIDLFDSFERAGYLRFHKEPNIQCKILLFLGLAFIC